jgi:excisionase family DNA binding protein
MERLLLRPDEAAETIGVGRATVYALVKKGELPSVRVGDSVRIPADGLRKWVDRKRREQSGHR